jgi:hypothetical protein
MSNTKTNILVTLALALLGSMLCGLLYSINTLLGPTTVAYNCSIAEISPDYPVVVKEACRKQRLEKK